MLGTVVILVCEPHVTRTSGRTAPKVERGPLGRQPLGQPLGGRRWQLAVGLERVP
jgi:hypothetical protein